MKLPINLATHPYENLRPFYSGAGIAAVVLAVLSLLVLWNIRQNRNENRSLIEKSSQMEKSMVDLRREQRELELWLARPEVQEIRDRSAFLNSIIVRKSLSWTRMFMDLEKIIPERVQVTAIRHSLNQAQQAELNLTVGSVTVQPLVQLLKDLEVSPQFGTPLVSSEHYPAEKSADPNILLDLIVQYHQIPGAESLPPSSSDSAAVPPVASADAHPEQPKLNPLPQPAAAAPARPVANPFSPPASSPSPQPGGAPSSQPAVQPVIPTPAPAPGGPQPAAQAVPPVPAAGGPHPVSPLPGPSSVPRPPDPPKGGN